MDEAPSRGPYKADSEISQWPRGATDSPAPRGAPSQGLPTTAGTCPLKHRVPASCSILDGKGMHQQESGIWGHSAICLGSRFLCLATKTGLVCCWLCFFFLRRFLGKGPGLRRCCSSIQWQGELGGLVSALSLGQPPSTGRGEQKAGSHGAGLLPHASAGAHTCPAVWGGPWVHHCSGHAASSGDAPAPGKDHFRGPHVGAPFLTTADADVDPARMLGIVLE